MGNKTSHERVTKNREGVETTKGEDGAQKNEHKLKGKLGLGLDYVSS